MICTDKTGTLTQNRMRVEALWTPAGGESRAADATSPAVDELLRAGVLCSDADGGVADPTEAALVAAAERRRDRRARRARAAAASGCAALRRGTEADAHRAPGRPGAIAYLKGAPEVVLAHCASDPDPPPHRRRGRRARRDAGCACSRAERGAGRRPRPRLAEAALAGGFDLLGLAAMVDPPRESAIDAVAACRAGRHRREDDHRRPPGHRAGDRARASGSHGRAFTGDELDALDDDGFGARRARRARVRPRRARAQAAARGALQARRRGGRDDRATASTTPRRSSRPTSASRWARAGPPRRARRRTWCSTDDDFASIEAAVEEGRHVFDNVQKAIAFALPTNLGEALDRPVAVLVFPFAGGVPLLPVEPTQILWVNLIATVTLALPLAVEAMEPALMERAAAAARDAGVGPVAARPDGRRRGADDGGGARRVRVELRDELATGVAPDTASRSGRRGGDHDRAVPGRLPARVPVAAPLDLPRRPGGNPWALAGIAAVLALQSAFIYAPPLQQAFGSAALDGSAWALAAAGALLVLPAVEAEKAVRSERGRRARDAGR